MKLAPPLSNLIGRCQTICVSADAKHEFAVFFAGREASGSFESTYWRYLVFVKRKGAGDWSTARVFELPDNHPSAWIGSLQSLEHSATEVKIADPAGTAQRGEPSVFERFTRIRDASAPAPRG